MPTTLQLPPVIGHRGACRYAPENTLASLRKAHELGARWIEFDVTLTQDGEAIIMHDDTLNRTTNGTGWVAETTSAQIASLDAGSWFGAEFIGEKVPTLKEYLACALELGLGINVEIKPTAGKDEATAQAVVEILKKHWPDTQREKLLVSSFSLLSLTQARALDNKLPLAPIICEWPAHWQATLERLACTSFHVKHTLLQPEKVVEIKSCVGYVLAYTVNEPAVAQTLFAMGVDAVFSDVPDIILTNLLKEDS